MNKKIISIFLIIIILSISINALSAVDSSNWKTQRVGDVDFRIAPEFENAQAYNNNIYYRTSREDFALRKMDDSLMEINYASDICSNNLSKMENKTIANHSAVILYVKTNSKDSMTEIYFTSKDSIYCLSFNGTDINSNIKEMIRTSPQSTIKTKSFHDQLNKVLADYIVYSGEDYNKYEQYFLGNYSYKDFEEEEYEYYSQEGDFNDEYYSYGYDTNDYF